MSLIRTTALSVVDRLYRFAGGRSRIGEADVAAPLQFVHDVGQEAEIDQTVVVHPSLSVVTAGAGAAVFSVLDRDDFITAGGSKLANTNRTVANSEFWLLRLGVWTTTPARMGGAVVGVRTPDNPNATADYLLFRGNSNVEPVVSGGQSPVIEFDGVLGNEIVSGWKQGPNVFPVRIRELLIRTTDDAGGANTVTYLPTVAITPKGVRPPWY